MLYAINIADWSTHKSDLGLKILLQPVVDQDRQVIAEPGRIDGIALQLNCDDKRGAAIIAMIRKKYPRNSIRCYHRTLGDARKRV